MARVYEIKLSGLTELGDQYVIPQKGVVIAQIEEGENIPLPNGKKVASPYIGFQNSEYKTYVVFRMYKKEVLTATFCYGKQIDFEELKGNSEMRRKFLKKIVSPKGLNKAQERCGYLIPVDTDIDENYDIIVPDDRSDTARSIRTNINSIFEGVLQSAHKEKIKGRESIKIEEEEVEDIEENEEEEEKSGFFETMSKIREHDPSNAKKQNNQGRKLFGKDGRIWQTLLAMAEDELAEDATLEVQKNEEKGIETPAKEKIGKKGVYCVFYRSGYVITEKGAGKYVPRYNVCFWDAGLKEKTVMTSFLISDVVEKKLSKNGVHRQKFVNNICAAILDSRDDMYYLDWDLPYLGKFSEDSRIGLDPDEEMQDYFQNLCEQTNPGQEQNDDRRNNPDDGENPGGGDERL